MMMQMLAGGGVPLLVDDERVANVDNPHGYYEYGPVKRIKEDTSWLYLARGKAVKVVSPLLRYLPPVHHYSVVFMQRDLAEVMASQRAMLHRRGETTSDDAAATMVAFEHHLAEVHQWLAAQPNIGVRYVNYRAAVDQPGEVVRLLDGLLPDGLSLAAMANAIDP
ncbi:MAG: sulfotransferase family protein [Deltaproteobacteria bacterium]|nr:sulfotransferase family protein [Deltaproteobacteria bacterium]MBI3388359.1 sulfotransferase family protein [Deltaproteobacteria bacterium]